MIKKQRQDSAILIFNTGSSSIKFSVFSLRSGNRRLDRLYRGTVEGIGGRPRFSVHDARKSPVVQRDFPADLPAISTHEEALALIREWLSAGLKGLSLTAAGHRVVHGGTDFSTPVWLDAGVIGSLEKLIPLAPLHQPHSLRVIRALSGIYPDLPQVACFDTAFHRNQPKVAEIFALPRDLTEAGLRRYGFHGLSYEFITTVLPEYLLEYGDAGIGRKRVVVAHLGNGASLCAISNGKGVATTMGFTPLDGLPMGTRSGSLDPGVILYLMTERGMKVEEVAEMLYHRSGLLGVSGVSHDMRELLASPRAEAAEAVDLFVYRTARELGSMAAALGGLDCLVFTAGIGENAPSIRRRICEAAAWMGIRLDPAANEKGGPRISTAESPVSVWVIPTDEERMIARHTSTLWNSRYGSH